MTDYPLTITKSILERIMEHSSPSNEVFSISSESSEFDELQQEEEIVNDNVVLNRREEEIVNDDVVLNFFGNTHYLRHREMALDTCPPTYPAPYEPSYYLDSGVGGRQVGFCSYMLGCCIRFLRIPVYCVSGISKWLEKGASHDTSNDVGHAAAVESSSRHLNQPAAAHQPEEDRLGNARLGYGLKLVRHGIYEDRPSSLIVLDFDFNYDSTCAITRAQISIIFGSKITQESDEPRNVSIVPFATDMRWPRKASGPLADTEISDQTTRKLNLGAQGYNIESPEFMRSISGKKTDSGWRIAGGPVFVNKPFPCRRGFLWTVNGHEFNRFPVPENFSLGMIVNHDMVDYWVQVNIEGSLRGVIKNHAAKLWAWSSRRARRWNIQPTESTAVLEEGDLVTQMQERYKRIYKGLHCENQVENEG